MEPGNLGQLAVLSRFMKSKPRPNGLYRSPRPTGVLGSV